MNTSYSIHFLDQNPDQVRFQILFGDQLISFEEVFQKWQTVPAFIRFYRDAVVSIGFDAFFWEHPGLSSSLLTRTYECVMYRSIPLETMTIDDKSFSKHFSLGQLVVDFYNLGGDARLVVPTPVLEKENYNHLGRVLRLAPEHQILALFQRIGHAIQEELSKGKVIWLSTAGLGVIWLHVRMDTFPKYYNHRPYLDPDYLQ